MDKKSNWQEEVKNIKISKRAQKVLRAEEKYIKNLKLDDTTEANSLQLAIAVGNYKKLKILINSGVALDIADSHGRTAIHVAASRGDVRAAKLLLRHGANPTVKSHAELSPLFYAITSNCVQAVEFFAVNGNDVNEFMPNWRLRRFTSYIHYAVINNQLEIVRALIRLNADVNACDGLQYTPLHLASILGQKEIALALLDNGARINDVEKNGKTALYLATLRRNTKMVRLLLNRNADPNYTDNKAISPLHLAVLYRDVSIIRELLQWEADVDHTTPDGSTLLHYAVCGDLFSMIIRMPFVIDNEIVHFNLYEDSITKVLLSHGIRVNVRNLKGDMPLHLAVYKGAIGLMGLLLEHGAEANAVNGKGKCPLEIAVASRQVSAIRLLLIHNANVGKILDMQLTDDMTTALASFFIAKRVGGMFVDRRVLDKVTAGKNWKSVEANCLDEVNVMKTLSIQGFSLCDIVRSSRRGVVAIESKYYFYDTLQFFAKYFEENLTIYGAMVNAKVEEAKLYTPVLNEATECLATLFPTLPAVPLDKIVSYLNIDDLRTIAHS